MPGNKNSGRSQACNTCKFAIFGVHMYATGNKHRCVVGCLIDEDFVNSGDCAAVVRVQPRRKCRCCKKSTLDWEEHKGKILCRACILGEEVIIKRPLLSSNASEIFKYAPSKNLWWAQFNRQLGAAMDKHGIPRPGFRDRADHQEEFGEVFGGKK